MEFMKVLTDNFWMTIVICTFIITIVSIVLGIILEIYKVAARSQQKMQELRNEELRLQLKLEQQKKEKSPGASRANLPLPKEPSWEEQSQTAYDVGYQQQR